MATEVKRRRGTTAQHVGFIGSEAEITVDTDKYTLLVHDDSGSAPTGHELLRADFSNAVFTVPDGRYLQLSGGTLTNSLTISANTPQLVLKDSTDDDDQSILFRNASNANLYSITGETDVLNIKTLTSRAMKFHTNNTLAMTIDTDGSIDTVQGLDVGGTLKPVSYTHLTLPTNREV